VTVTRGPSQSTEDFIGSPRYRALRKLGQGGMGAVWEVEDRERGGRCALKVMPLATDGEGLLRFKREFRSVAGIDHPNLVRLLDLATDGERWFYTMELVDGVDFLTAVAARHASEPRSDRLAPPSTETLRLRAPALGDARPFRQAWSVRPRTLPTTPCDLERLGVVLPQLLDALACLHEHGLVHRDLKPKNILVSPVGRLRLLDFGIVQRLAADRLTAAGTIIGTLAYMSPEQCEEAEITPASDLYSLGCLLFHVLAGAPPFGGGTAR
jgi:serine/threonine-protein kinase